MASRPRPAALPAEGEAVIVDVRDSRKRRRGDLSTPRPFRAASTSAGPGGKDLPVLPGRDSPGETAHPVGILDYATTSGSTTSSTSSIVVA